MIVKGWQPILYNHVASCANGYDLIVLKSDAVGVPNMKLRHGDASGSSKEHKVSFRKTIH
jgi:hypothetical protein